ncbi:MAG: NAD(P)H-hydrate dehydratase [Marinoscillum sp.]|uniref:NAD(P)H-hydrate dehydratase n=1 Tax=Marinoscillum sp. TaxID=2024838 RepID=UPI0032F7B057
MIPILSAQQIRDADQYTIDHEPITSINLMERASRAFVRKFSTLVPGGGRVMVFCGTGNNGGDGLVIARVLIQQAHDVSVFFVGHLDKATEDFKVNFERLSVLSEISQIASEDQIPNIPENAVVIDGLFGSGLSRPVKGLYASVIERINQSGAAVYAIDISSGLYPDQPLTDGAVIQAACTISFQTPKLIFFLPEMRKYVGTWHVVDIGLDDAFIQGSDTNVFFTQPNDVVLPLRSTFDHKGSAGRLLLIAGSKGKMGAATLSARAALRSGCGLLYVHTPCCGLNILQVNVPEAMVIEDEHTEVITEVVPADNVDVLAMGPGIGTNSLTQKALADLILHAKEPMVLDADALNILAQNPELLSALPPESILTPHPGEFARLVGAWRSDFEKLEKLRWLATTYQLNVVLKGAYSAVCNSRGSIYFNPTGNPGMATAGSGDVLTGIVAALLAQGLAPFEALRSGVYLHGQAGDEAAIKVGEVSLMASDLIEHLPAAFKKLHF